ncbi:ATP-binding protein [Streptomyces sp. SID8352]|nr:ATP-binding protein [Streptomyces sp. SID8352]
MGYGPINPTKSDKGGGSSAGEVRRVTDMGDGCAEWVFPAAPDAVRTARAFVRRQLRDWGLAPVGDLTVLLVSELVTNSLRHATGPIGVRLVRPSGPAWVLLVEVSDPQPELPRERVARPEDEGGRGLFLVATASRRWGATPGDAGKTVWFEVAAPR